jgi:hypothetical protein
MYAGITLRNGSGNVIGVHQRINRIARARLDSHISDMTGFPNIQDILFFEGKNGPDAIKRKSPLQDEPFHFIDPSKPDDQTLLILINDHIINLSKALAKKDTIRASFEAAWLAHAVVDGLTPAHHCPMDERAEALIAVTYGLSKRKIIIEKMKYWGMGGAWNHIRFEGGVVLVLAACKLKTAEITDEEIARIDKLGFEPVFLESLNKIYNMRMYDELYDIGWSRHLARQTKRILAPEIVKMVTLAWYRAATLINEPIS